MIRSPEIAGLAAALAKAQGEMEFAVENKENPFYKSTYADLASVWKAMRAPLSKHGLSVLQLPEADESGNIRVSTLLMHSSGQFIEASYTLKPTKNDPQGYGSSISYMKRYALTGLGVAPLDAPLDDDGNAASVKTNRPVRESDKPKHSVVMAPTKKAEILKLPAADPKAAGAPRELPSPQQISDEAGDDSKVGYSWRPWGQLLISKFKNNGDKDLTDWLAFNETNLTKLKKEDPRIHGAVMKAYEQYSLPRAHE